jgi:hypothetical protein
MITVKQLIEHLQTLPQDSPVLYRCCSDWSIMELYQVVAQRASDPLVNGMAVEHHNMPGKYRCYSGPLPYRDRPLPTPADVVTFPGN